MHRPTWNTSIGFATGNTSKVFSTRDMAGETRLKFRKPGQGTTTEIERKDLKLELLAAERESESRKAKGLPGFAGEGVALIEAAPVSTNEDTKKRREAIALVGGLDADDEDEDDIVIPSVSNGKGKGRATSSEIEQDFKAKEDDDDDDEEEESSDDDEDETAELLRELEKIKRERAEEREKIEREKAASDYVSREEEIATGNPLLNLQSALNIPGSPSPSISSTGSSSFGIKRRWDDDVIFKNQARGTSETPKKEFVNDLLRSEFHKRFMKKHIA